MSDGNGKREVLLIKEFQKEYTNDAGERQGKIWSTMLVIKSNRVSEKNNNIQQLSFSHLSGRRN